MACWLALCPNSYVPAFSVSPLIDPVLTDVTVDEGVNQDLVCKVSGSPQPMVEWLKEDVPYRPQTVNCNFT